MIAKNAEGFVLVENGEVVLGPMPSRSELIQARKKQIRREYHASLRAGLVLLLLMAAGPVEAQGFGSAKWKRPVANAAALPTCDASSDGETRVTLDDGTAHTCLNGSGWQQHAGGGGGSAITLDLADDASNESSDLTEIATSGDTNSIFTEPASDKLLIDLSQNWPSADTADALSANGANCDPGEIPLGVDANGAVEGCYEPAEADISDLDHTATAITDGLIVEADLNEDSGTPTDEDVLTYDSTGGNFNWVAQSTLAAGTAASLAANGANCAAGEVPLGVDASGAVEGCYEPSEADISDLSHTVDTNLTQEEVEDYAGALVAAGTGTHTGVTVTYQDATGDVDFVVDLGTDIAVSELATGTDGELITWDTSGNPTTVAVGTSGQVLTSNGAGSAPTFQAAAGSGISNVVEDTTPQLGGDLDLNGNLIVGSGGDSGEGLTVDFSDGAADDGFIITDDITSPCTTAPCLRVNLDGVALYSEAGTLFWYTRTSPTSLVINEDLSFGGDVDVYIDTPGTDQLRLVAGGQEGIHLGESSNVVTVTIDDKLASGSQSVTLGAAATTFATVSNFVTVTGDGGGNTLSTITGGAMGMVLRILFVDANVTITDTDAHTANTVDLSAAFTSADDTILTLIYDGTSWYEVSRSVN